MGFVPEFETTPMDADTTVPLTTTVHRREYPADAYDD